MTIDNCTITQNTGSEAGGLRCFVSSPFVTNSILWNDSLNEIFHDYLSDPTVTFSDIQGGWEGDGNIEKDPLFMNTDFNNYHLQTASPCIDAGDSTIQDACLPPGLGEDRSDMGAFGGEINCSWLERSIDLLTICR